MHRRSKEEEAVAEVQRRIADKIIGRLVKLGLLSSSEEFDQITVDELSSRFQALQANLREKGIGPDPYIKSVLSRTVKGGKKGKLQ